MADYDPAAEVVVNGESDEAGSSSSIEIEQTEPVQDEGDDEDEDEDYDPSSFNFGDSEAPTPGALPATNGATPNSTAVQEPQQSVPAQQSQKKVGGFIVEDDDDDEDGEEESVTTPVPSQLNGVEGAQSGLGAVAVSEAQDVPLASAPTTDTAALPATSSTSLNGSAATSVSVPDHPTPLPSNPSLTAIEADQGNTLPSSTSTPQPAVTAAPVPATQVVPAVSGGIAARLPHDKVGRLEDRIKEDPKADTEAWYSLIAHYKEKDQLDNVRKTYDRFLEVFPTSAAIWIEYIRLELEQMARNNTDNLLARALGSVQDLDLWRTYLNYLRRILPLTNDPNGENRTTLTQGFETVLDNVGLDPDAGEVWSEYIDFISSGPGVVGGTSWQDAQKMDLLRKAYQRSVRLPHSELLKLWKEYDKFEMTLNKTSGRKALQEQSPHYMTARSANMALDQHLRHLDRKSLPKLPPVNGCEGDDEFAVQVESWRGWIELEKTDPLVLKDEDISAYRKRIVYTYKQAVMALRFYPTIWFEAVQWCFDQLSEDMIAQGEAFLQQGMDANPESVLLALKKADRIESTLETGNTEEIVVRNGEKLDVPYETLHKALYSLREKFVQREKRSVAEVQEHFASLPPDEVNEADVMQDDDDDEDPASKPKTREEHMQAEVAAVQAASKEQLELLKRIISYVWVAKMRAFRRIQGQGAPNKPRKGFRGVFAEARPRGQVSSDVYIASALMEWHCYQDGAATKIFERGLKLFPTDEVFAQEYIKHLISINDLTNARVVFETTITKILAINPNIASEQQKRFRLRALLKYMHNFESNYGDLAQIRKIEKRMSELYPTEPEIARFARRFAGFPPATFDAIDEELAISPTQTRSKAPGAGVAGQGGQHGTLPSVEAPSFAGDVRLGPNGPYMASPKRPLDDSDAESPARKFLRGDSPLKGAAGRRIASNAASMAIPMNMPGASAANASLGVKTYVPGATVDSAPATFEGGVQLLPKPIYEFIRKLPNARDYNGIVFDPTLTVEFLRGYDLTAARARAGR